MSSNKSDELDLMSLYRKVKEGYRAMLLGIYRWIVFLIKFWYVALLVILIGFLLGYFEEKNTPLTKETTMLVQLNFDSVDYVYNDVKNLKKKINEEDKRALSDVKEFFGDIFEVKNITIEPLPDIRDLAMGIDPNNRNVDVFLQESKYEDDLLMSEMFLSQYKLHKITITATEKANRKSLEGIIAYLNSNENFEQIKMNGIKNLNFELAETKESIEALDSILSSASKTTERGGQVYVNTSSFVNMHSLVQEKMKLIAGIQYMETDLLRYHQGIVALVNKPHFQYTRSFFDNKKKLYPVLFFIFFIITVALVNLFKRLREIDSASKTEKV